MSRRVIINADDLGIDDARTRGILDAHRNGIVTSASLLANSPSLDGLAATLGDTPALGVGVHLNLSEGRALLSHPRSLTDREGRFFERASVLRRLVEGRFDEEEIRTEFDLQIRRVRDTGIDPSHIDSHHHVHLYPGVMAAACWAARRNGIGKVRLPREPVPSPGSLPSRHYWELVRRQGLLGRASAVLSAEGLKAPDHFRGLTLTGGIHFDRFLEVLMRLPEGTSEVLVHPGHRDPGGKTFATEEREKELLLLTDPGIRSALAGCGIDLISYRDL